MSNAQNTLIKGKAHESYAGKIIELFSTIDYITGTKQKENQDTIDVNGYFELSFHTDLTKSVTLKINQVITKLYVEPNFVYGVIIPELNKSVDYQNGAELPVNISIVGADTTELNMMIFDYDSIYNNLFIPKNKKFISRTQMFKLTDSLKKIYDIKLNKNKNQYFKSFINYSVASINSSLSRGENYLIQNYIINKPIQYNHQEYMQFFNSCFKGFLNDIASSKEGESLYNIINIKSNYTLLNNYLKNDKYLKNDSLRELVIINNLWDFYFSSSFDADAIKNIITQLNLETKNNEHKAITDHMLAYFNKMQAGSLAPMFSARSQNGAIGSLDNFKGKWVYINFFSTKNIESLKEMSKILNLKKKYGVKIVFLSICLDDSLADYKNYLKSNPKFDWQIWYNNEKSITKTAKEVYNVIGTEHYFLINNYGYLIQSPALSPSKGIEFKLNIIFKPNKKTTKIGIR